MINWFIVGTVWINGSYWVHCNEKDTARSVLAISNIRPCYMHRNYSFCNRSAICGLSCSN